MKNITRRVFCSVSAASAITAALPIKGSAEESKIEKNINRSADFALQSPYRFGKYQHKVQLHTHTSDCDCDHSGQWVMKAYEQMGYTAVAKTDHDHRHWTPNLDDPGGHSIIHIPGLEYSGDDDANSWNHMLEIGISSIYHKKGIGARQAQIDQAKKEGGLTFLCHPYDESIHRRGWCDEDILEMVEGFDGIEIHNGGSYHAPGGRDYPYKVDLALQAGKRVNVIAVDDYHRNPRTTLDRGFVVVNSDLSKSEITYSDIMSSLRSGNFFAAGRVNTSHPTPPMFTEISVDGHLITVKTDKLTDIEFITNRYNYYKEGANFAQIRYGTKSAQYIADKKDVFIRIKAAYTEDGESSFAWSNPIYVV